MAQKIFELNGKAYDALTGAYLGSAKRPEHTVNVRPMQPKPVPQSAVYASGPGRAASMDGIINSTGRSSQATTGQKHLSAHQPQPTKTLMRRAVTKPVTVQAAAKPAAGNADFRSMQPSLRPAQPAQAGLTPKLSSQVVDPMRARRAQGIRRSQSVEHFKPAVTVPANPYTINVTAAPRPQPQAGRQTAPATATTPSRTYSDFNRPVRPSYRSQRPTAASVSAAIAPAAATPQPLSVTNNDNDAEFDLFAEALAHASSHQEEAPQEITSKRSSRRKRQMFGIAASLAVFALLAGFIGFQNRDDIRLQLASAKAGFSAAVPLSMPAGYAMDKLSYAPGNVGMVFSKGSSQSFTITQKKSNWDSQTLLENFVATSNDDYRGYQSNGRTVYVYGKGKATWVNGGIWYQLQDNGSLSDEQLVHIAASM